MKFILTFFAALFSASSSIAAPVSYVIDPEHTHPSFETDHLGGLSTWRGTFRTTTGKIILDKQAGIGTVDIAIDVASVDLAHDKLNEEVSGPKMFDSAKFPKAYYKGTIGGFSNGVPRKVEGELTLHGVTKPVSLSIDAFKCIHHPMLNRDVCGANAIGTFNRADFGVNFGQKYGFNQIVSLRIQVEAQKE